MAVFGEQLVLTRLIEADLGGSSVRISDTVTNAGATPCPHMMLYHCNIGFPVVDAGAELRYPAPPGTCVSEASTEQYWPLDGPDPGYVEQCYEHDMTPDATGLVTAAVLNRAAGPRASTSGTGKTSYRTTSPGGSSAPEPTWSRWSRARTGTPAASTPAQRGELIHLDARRAAPVRPGARRPNRNRRRHRVR